MDLSECYRAVGVEEQFREVFTEWAPESLPRQQRTVYRSMVGRSL